MSVELHHGDCLDIMPTLPDHSFDAIIADLPYGTTACKWDSVIPFEPLWEQYKRMIKKRGAIVLFGSQPFTSALVMSNVEWFKYCWVWQKSRPSDFINAKNKPLKDHEDLIVFSPGTIANCSPRKMTYNPQGIRYNPGTKKRHVTISGKAGNVLGFRPSHKTEYDYEYTDYPRAVIFFPSVHNADIHPTQKPVALLEYLIKTYTNEGDTVLDNTMGSGTTMVACVHTRRNGVGIEMLPVKEDDPDYFGIAQGRVEHAQNEIVQLALI